ncbi:DUF6712 family protein [Phocaeicola paurosaccharolyticus]|uniref:DUF6712 family protein n=1 Tax=Phocaeicola paurosaccharolyticus TaxID=732242 RepID=UPI002FE3EE56
MIFSREKWNNGDEIKEFVKVSSALSFTMMETPLQDAFRLYVSSLLGAEMAEKVIEIYNADAPSQPTDEDKRNLQLLKLCQRANANLAFYYDFDEINTRITDAGFQRQESENSTFKQTYKYQEDNLRNGFKNKGFNALDTLLEFLYDNIPSYPEFKESGAYIAYKNSIVKSAKDINEIFFINSSRLIFLRMQSHLQYAEDMFLVPTISEKLTEQLHAWLNDDTLSDDEKKKIEKLRKACSHYICAIAIKRILMETGSLTDRGLFFTSIEASQVGNENIKPVDTDRISVQIQNMQCDIDAYQNNLVRLIRISYPEYYTGNPAQTFDRDNDCKQTFFA